MNKQNIFNVLFAVAILISFILILNKSPKQKSGEIGSSMKIAFVNSDSLMVNYDMFNDMKTELEIETDKMRSQLATKEQSLQDQIMAFQKRIQAGTISEIDAKKTEDNLRKQQQEYIEMNEKFSNQIANKEFEMSKSVLDSVQSVIEEINKIENYDYVLGFTKGAGILYANPNHDITNIVVEVLNKNYKKSKSKK